MAPPLLSKPPVPQPVLDYGTEGSDVITIRERSINKESTSQLVQILYKHVALRFGVRGPTEGMPIGSWGRGSGRLGKLDAQHVGAPEGWGLDPPFQALHLT